MKIAIITDNYLPRSGGVANVMVNVSNNFFKFGVSNSCKSCMSQSNVGC